MRNIVVRPVVLAEKARYQELMQAHHYLGSCPKIGETLWYVATYEQEWVALVSFSAAAWKCSARDLWIGWNFRYQYDRLKLVANNSRFLILPNWHLPNIGSKVLSLSVRRLADDWLTNFGHPLLLLETFVDPQRFRGTVYRAANWTYVGNSRGFSRTRDGYSAHTSSPKMVFVKTLQTDAKEVLSRPVLDQIYQIGAPKMQISANNMRSLPDFFKDVSDPRRTAGRRHQLPTILAIAAAATLCGMRGYKAMADWAGSLGQKARARFRCRHTVNGYIVPSESIIRDILVRVDPDSLDQALQRWNAIYGGNDSSLAIDGKTMCNSIDEEGRQTHIMSVVGHDTKICYTQKKLVLCR
jgi:hypothetical protein